MTRPGRAALETLRDRYLGVVASSLATWTDAELTTLADTLRRLQADLTDAAHQPPGTTRGTATTTGSAAGDGTHTHTIDITGQEAYA